MSILKDRLQDSLRGSPSWWARIDSFAPAHLPFELCLCRTVPTRLRSLARRVQPAA